MGLTLSSSQHPARQITPFGGAVGADKRATVGGGLASAFSASSLALACAARSSGSTLLVARPPVSASSSSRSPRRPERAAPLMDALTAALVSVAPSLPASAGAGAAAAPIKRAPAPPNDSTRIFRTEIICTPQRYNCARACRRGVNKSLHASAVDAADQATASRRTAAIVRTQARAASCPLTTKWSWKNC